MKVAVADWDVAYPLNSGKRIRTTQLMLELAKRHQLTYVSRGSDADAAGRTSREFLGDHGIRTHYLDSPIPPKSGLGYPLRLLRNAAFSKQPYVVDVHAGRNFLRRYRQFASRESFDLWQLEWTPYSRMLRGIDALTRVLVAHNVDSLIWKRYAETETRPLHREFFKRQLRRFQAFEAEAFREVNRVVAVSQPDADLMRSMFGINHVDVVDNGVDLETYSKVQRQPMEGQILFLGSLDWRPNQDAITLLLDEIFPLVRQRMPGATLHIVGRRPPDSMRRQAAAVDGVSMHVDVPEVFPHLASAQVMAIPLRIGGGSRLKMIEALAAGVPVVASTIAAEGLDLAPGHDYMLADTPEQSADAIVKMMLDPARAASLVQTGLASVRRRYGWPRLATKLEGIWETCVAGSRPTLGKDSEQQSQSSNREEIVV
ncbi:MAG: glycosyltransferase family 4 protein [Planctomycetota bacterium]